MIPFPRITKLIDSSKENITSLEFENNDIINISIGDLEVLRFENMSTFNMNDKTSTYNYIKSRNYETENDHIKYCENCTCMINSSYYLVLRTEFGTFDTPLEKKNFFYENKNLKNFDTVDGEIEMSNFSIPFDFDGNKFLFLDYNSPEERRLCIHYTLTKEDNFEKIIQSNCGHISQMKLLPNDRLFLCMNNNECEIHKISDDFPILEKWVHNGKEVISSSVYISGKKLSKSWKKHLFKKSEKNIIKQKKGNGLNDNTIANLSNNLRNFSNTVGREMISSSEKESDNNVNYNYTESVPERKNNRNSIIHSSTPSLNNSSRREINLTSENKTYVYKKSNNASRRKKSSKSGSGIEIYDKREANNVTYEILTKKKKNNNLNPNTLIRNNLPKLSNYLHKIRKEEEEQNNKFEVSHIKEKETYTSFYVLTLDIKGNVNLYHNKKQKTIFNLYDISNIAEKYKKMEFFSVGFPYFAIMNELYYVITTDHGIFVIGKDKNP